MSILAASDNFYPVIPRGVDSSGAGRFAVIHPVRKAGRYGTRSVQIYRRKALHQVELAWEGVPAEHLRGLEEVIEASHGGAGVVVTPTFATVPMTGGIPYKGGSRLRTDWAANLQQSWIDVEDVSSFATWDFVITAGVNDAITFTYKDQNDTVQTRTAYVTAGTYTGANPIAEALQQAMNAVIPAGDPGFDWDYMPYDGRFYVQEAQNGKQKGLLQLNWFTSAYATRQIGATLGFDVSRDAMGKIQYLSDYFYEPFGYRVMITTRDLSQSVIGEIYAIDAVNKKVEFLYREGLLNVPDGVARGGLIEPVFNAELILPEEEDGYVWGLGWTKGQKGIVNAAITLREVLNA